MTNKILAKWAHFIIHEISTIVTKSPKHGNGRRSSYTINGSLQRSCQVDVEVHGFHVGSQANIEVHGFHVGSQANVEVHVGSH